MSDVKISVIMPVYKVEKYVNVLDYTSFDEYEEDVEECLARLKKQEE